MNATDCFKSLARAICLYERFFHDAQWLCMGRIEKVCYNHNQKSNFTAFIYIYSTILNGNQLLGLS